MVEIPKPIWDSSGEQKGRRIPPTYSPWVLERVDRQQLPKLEVTADKLGAVVSCGNEPDTWANSITPISYS